MEACNCSLLLGKYLEFRSVSEEKDENVCQQKCNLLTHLQYSLMGDDARWKDDTIKQNRLIMSSGV